MSKTYTAKDVAEHKDEKNGGVWIIVDNGVYDVTKQSLGAGIPQPRNVQLHAYQVTKSLTAPAPRSLDFLDEHPGGAKILKRMGGKNASKQFWKYHGDGVLAKYGPKLKIGELAETAKL
ncbi:hypothetical protein DL766_001919 [Monosporascus sp. MC13-8B]|uniref:Cytochrome b5 heme-binding domain-containing protein n=1 Tax=Monosporascus cannonballus TaxID=155416 RepID=A0ABY0HIP4_9PEZI|nr:hypothetical protein DL763_004714 [Monosporascus cannonballus]RYO93992.1 hypothetical protein DL762_000740 [Monosporascus cannonballus]RYP36679.1 hypothetical protein DL766_001919 [Monosporascus sp. MC13-8B]